jgi:hypothetical protein
VSHGLVSHGLVTGRVVIAQVGPRVVPLAVGQGADGCWNDAGMTPPGDAWDSPARIVLPGR